MRVDVPEAVGSGAASTEEGNLPIHEADDGTRYVETELDTTARVLAANWERAHEDYEAAISDATTGEDDDTTHGPENDDAPTCAGETADGDPCTREVDEPGDYCYQHP